MGVVCSMPQDFKRELFFRQLNGFSLRFKKYFGSTCDKIHNRENKVFAHFNRINYSLLLVALHPYSVGFP